MAVGRPGVPSWIDAAGDQQHRRAGERAPAADEEWAPAGTVGGASRLQAALSRLLAYGLWGVIALALVLGLVNCAGSPSAAPPTDDDGSAMPVPPPGGCAELLVAGWLAGDTELLAEIPGMPRGRPEPDQRRAVDTYTAAVTPGDGAWGYLIGADVEVRAESEPGDTGPAGSQPTDPQTGTATWRSVGTQFFRVTMVPGSGGCQGWRPAALPAQVPAPPLAGDPSVPYEQPYPVSLTVSDTELSQTLEAFFAGMLTGSESLERYVAPGVYIAPLVPPPYHEVTVSELRAREELAAPVPADGTVVSLLVTVTAADETGAEDLPLVYPVTAGVRGGRWEVMALDPLVGTTVQAPLPESTHSPRPPG